MAAPAALALASLSLLPWSPLAALSVFAALLAVAAFTAAFFRDPEREIGEGVVSPADGVVMRADATPRGACFSIFMNLHNVHVNRAPWPGRVLEITRVSGGHAPAYRKEADRNERVRITMETTLGRVVVTQLVGVLARRIVTYVRAGQELAKGERIGMIRFGSRVDLFIPPGGIQPAVRRGDRVLAGTTTLAYVGPGTGGGVGRGRSGAGGGKGGESEGRGRQERGGRGEREGRGGGAGR